MHERHYTDRREAGRILAEQLVAYAGRDDVIVLGLPRGGVPVAFEIARALDAPLDVIVVRKLVVPGHAGTAVGAIAPGDVRVLNEPAIEDLGVPRSTIERLTALERQELARCQRAYRGTRPPLGVRGRTVILVDDGLATGSSMAAAVAALREWRPASIVVAVPVASSVACAYIRLVADACHCAQVVPPLHGHEFWYDDFHEVSEAEVRALVSAAAGRRHTRQLATV